ncbi:hypothetical protein AIOL_003712 [Candidatus Rhodobacter oscarellae]|uniref:DUF4387 domain-containing protein n=1 Tax=Candidatus Rhodobacter oscarellae TaxID=1675527 RepID=A0A0J9GZ38_9RHOB|nr:DUF4387 family protein [Candidatus Rhodobacter lobularis]KMW58733.1 hypothetical protein AIOL_003712 [Candidatus Rhodobacter lobularis]
MAELGSIVEKVRSKNAGPFWLTIDIFCGSAQAFARVRDGVSTDRVAGLFQTEASELKRFDIPSLNVVKFSLPRPQVQGTRADRDMHGASYAALIAELEVN